MEERHRKVRRVHLRSGIPHAKLVRLLGDLQKEDDVASALQVSRFKLRGAWRDVYSRVGRKVDVVFGNMTKWAIVSFKLALMYLVATAPAFQELLRETWVRRPCSQQDPWSLIVYGDEIVPGNVLRPENYRKLFCWYCTIKELGPQRTKHEICWIPLAVLRSNLMKGEVGRVSVATEVLLRETLVQDRLATEGVCLDLKVPGGGFATLYFKLGNIVADADGHRGMWSVKGSSGKLPCPWCLNIVNDEDMPLGSNQIVSMASTDPRHFELARDADWFAKADMLANRRGAMPKGEFKDMQTATGLTYVDGGLLWSSPLRHMLRPTATFTYDSMHCILSNGIANTELDAMLARLLREGITFSDIRGFLKPWKFCKVYGKKGAVAAHFTPSRQKSVNNDGCLRVGASEMLLLYPLVLYFLQRIIAQTGKLVHEIKSFEALALVLELIRRGKEGFDVSADLEDALVAHAKAFANAYPELVPKPKARFVFHIWLQLRRDAWIIDAFVGERKHIGVKSVGNDIDNTKVYVASVLFLLLPNKLLTWRSPPGKMM